MCFPVILGAPDSVCWKEAEIEIGNDPGFAQLKGKHGVNSFLDVG